MSKYDCIAICFASVSLAILLSVIAVVTSFHKSVEQLTDALAQQGITDRIELDSLTITSPNGVVVTLLNPDITMNSRLLDIFLGIAVSESSR